MDTDLSSILSDEGQPNPEPQAETPAPAQEPTGEQQAATPAEPQEDAIDTHRKGLEAAVVAERTKRQNAEARARAVEEQYRAFVEQQQPQKPAGDEPPDPAAFQDNPQEYWRLLARHEARQELQQAVQQAQEQRQQQERQTQAADHYRRVMGVVETGQSKYRDFDVVINSGLGPFLNDTLRDAIADIPDVGADVSYWLAKNPAEASRISQLPERQMVRELAKVELKAVAPARQPIPQTLTQARDTRGQFTPNAYTGPTPLDDILNHKR